LVDYISLDGPEQLTLQHEETDALAVALDQLDETDRDLLLRHEDEAVDLATLAAELNTTQGAVAMPLARARAVLRLEFLLAFRHHDLPSSACRPVLLALSAGDRRRQQRLDARGHLAICPTCASLAHPITERDRRTAGWIPLPLAGLAGRLWDKIRSNPAPLAAGGLAAVAVAVAAAVTVFGGTDEAPRSDAVPSVPTAVATTTANNRSGWYSSGPASHPSTYRQDKPSPSSAAPPRHPPTKSLRARHRGRLP
jgi:serine/threonine-protein kinase RsbT